MPVTNLPPDDDDILLWGSRAIGAAINQKASQVFPMLRGKIKCAVKRNGRWTAWRKVLRQEFGIADARQKEALTELGARN
jgi:hypothetical protein